jgi:hypothetical protein
MKRATAKQYQQAVGACALHWNEAESLIDHFACVCLQIPTPLRPAFAVKLTVDGKIDMIKARLELDLGKEDKALKQMTELLGHAKGLKKHRDYLIHLVPNYELHTGTVRQWKTPSLRIPMKIEDISAIAAHLDALVEELMRAEDVFLVLYGEYGAPLWLADQDAQRRQQGLQEAVASIRDRLKERQSLPRLPPLPK